MAAIFQTNPGTEGDVLWRAGMIEKIWEDGRVAGFEPTGLLRSLFAAMPPLEDAYPPLVDFALSYRYRRSPGFVSDAEHARTAARLRELGMTQDGVEKLSERLVGAIGENARAEVR